MTLVKRETELMKAILDVFFRQAPFMHSNWSVHRNNWIKAVHMCNKPQEFALALSILEGAMKPVIFTPLWLDGMGHIRLIRTTALEREERKKAEKKRRDEEDDIYKNPNNHWVKYTFPIKHLVRRVLRNGLQLPLYGFLNTVHHPAVTVCHVCTLCV